ncbi:hypothetical protein RRSWK_01303 [Rhodopirellula sp. SWK7]|nr:hypothetical protein RRSWK_01303 [Rhodopirellula sp. SWK7]
MRPVLSIGARRVVQPRQAKWHANACLCDTVRRRDFSRTNRLTGLVRKSQQGQIGKLSDLASHWAAACLTRKSHPNESGN